MNRKQRSWNPIDNPIPYLIAAIIFVFLIYGFVGDWNAGTEVLGR
jgi:hypothetical protein